FFSSRRRHTRFSRDWSSDVCSSDLSKNSKRFRSNNPRRRRNMGRRFKQNSRSGRDNHFLCTRNISKRDENDRKKLPKIKKIKGKIGRASCRERVKVAESAVTLRRKE